MQKKSAGLLIYRQVNNHIKVMLVHPGGPFWAKKDLASWSIPKGEFEMGDDPLAAAIREVKEETGLEVNGDFFPLDPVRQKSGKIIYAFALEGDYDVDNITSNIFEMTWPPNSGTLKSFPEVDRAAWFNLEEAATKIIAGQLPLLHQLKELLGLPSKK